MNDQNCIRCGEPVNYSMDEEWGQPGTPTDDGPMHYRCIQEDKIDCLEAENADLRSEIAAIKSGKTAEAYPSLGMMWAECPHCEQNFMLVNLEENGG